MERSERLNGDSEPKSIHESPEGNIRNMDKWVLLKIYQDRQNNILRHFLFSFKFNPV